MALLQQLTWAALALSGFACASYFSVSVPRHPQHDRQVIDSSYQSLSIELFAFMEYSGNATYSHPLNTNLINHLRDLGNAPLKVRVGGSSQGFVYWIPDQEQGLIGYYSDGEIDKTYNVTLGPAFFEAFDSWPSDTHFVLGLPYPEDGQGLLEANIEIARGAYRKLGPRLVGLEIGNERQDSGTPEQFTSNFLDAAYRISEEVFGDRHKQIYTAGTLHAPTLIQCEDEEDKENCWSVRPLFENGINEKGVIKVADTHQYKLLYETPTRSITRQNLLNHTSTAWYVNSHDFLAAFTTAQGIPYVLGETNSLFGHGRRNVSDTFAAALWTIDYTLYSAQTNITNLGFHQSWGAWRPIAAWGEPSGLLPAYYGFWLVHKALGIDGRRTSSHGGGKQVEVLLEEDLVSAYAIYDSKSGSLSSVVALNLADWHSAGKEDERTKVTIQLENLRPRGWQGEVYRLTAPGADVKDPEVISFAGQYVDDVEGAVHGRVDTETLGRDGKFTLKASEAAVVMFDY